MVRHATPQRPTGHHLLLMVICWNTASTRGGMRKPARGGVLPGRTRFGTGRVLAVLGEPGPQVAGAEAQVAGRQPG